MPLQSRGSRSMQVFFVNGRFIKSQLLTAALEEGYRNQIMKGKFPGCVLSVTLPVTAVDVNVHPAKTTVKFAREKEVFDAVYHTVLDSLSAREARCKSPGAWSRWCFPAGLLPVPGRQELSGAEGAGGLPAPERGEARLGQRAALHGPCSGQRPSGLRLWEVPGCGRRPGKASGIGGRPNRGRDFAGR